MRNRAGARLGLGLGLVAACASALAMDACRVYDDSLLVGPPVGPGGGVGYWSRLDDTGCFSASRPRLADRPRASAAKALDPIYLAVSQLRLGSFDREGRPDPQAWQDLGFDLDGVCSGSETCAGSEARTSCRPLSGAVPFDGRYCRDNTFGRLAVQATNVPDLVERYGLNDDAFNCALCSGEYNYLFKISGYSGGLDDDEVRIDLYPSPGLETPLGWDCRDPGWKKLPCFLSNMRWTIDEKSMSSARPGPDLGDSKLYDDRAFVRGGYFFATFPADTLFWFRGKRATVTAFPLALKQGVVTGKLERGPSGAWQVSDGVIAGRVLGGDLVRGFRYIGLCEDDPSYELITTFIDTNLDIRSDGREGTDVACDAMSLGVGFSAVQATAGRFEQLDERTECAAASAVDAGGD